MTAPLSTLTLPTPTLPTSGNPETLRHRGSDRAALDDANRRSSANPTEETAQSGSAELAQERREADEIRELVRRDREVRAHKAAHLAAGGRHTSRATFIYERAPNGVLYAVGGEVETDLSPVTNNPEATLRTAQALRQAALAPAQPSAQDRVVAQKAAQMALQARAELLGEAISGDNETAEEPSTGNDPAAQKIQSGRATTTDESPDVHIDLFA